VGKVRRVKKRGKGSGKEWKHRQIELKKEKEKRNNRKEMRRREGRKEMRWREGKKRIERRKRR